MKVVMLLMSVLLFIFNHLLPLKNSLATLSPSMAACESVLILTLVLVSVTRITVHIAINSALVEDATF